MSDGGDCRTAPATPGLLKKHSKTESLPIAAQTQHKSLKKATGCQLGSIKVIISNLKQTTGQFKTYGFCQS